MKRVTFLGSILMLVSISFSSVSATLLTKEEVKLHPEKYVRIGVISTSAATNSPTDAKAELSKMADEKGGKYFVVTSANTEQKYSATAIVYKDK